MKRSECRTPAAGWVRLVALVALAVSPLGCGESGPEMARVTGRVTYQGKPVSKGTVAFHSTDPQKRPNATGTLDPNGYYKLQTHEPGDGAQLGDYDVTIYSHDDATMNIGGVNIVPQYIPKTPVKPKPLTPTKYEDPKTSGLRKTVKSGSNTFDFELTD
ncbi:MAG TPA: hypothetical protein VFF52_22595 [Isosphaeraceae bacterium]|nr:hypothetical protein [Isosphaeraceae bacterium]